MEDRLLMCELMKERVRTGKCELYLKREAGKCLEAHKRNTRTPEVSADRKVQQGRPNTLLLLGSQVQRRGPELLPQGKPAARYRLERELTAISGPVIRE